MSTIQDIIGNHTPLSNNIVKELKLVRGAIACKIFFTSNLKDRVCRMGLTRLASELGIDSTTASKNIKWLIENEYVELVKDHTATDPAHYRCTDKFYLVAQGIDVINRGVDLINRGVDLINQEEELKEDKKKDYTDLIFSHQSGQEAVGQPNDFQKHFGYRDEFLSVYNQLTGEIPNPTKKQQIIDISQEPSADVDIWRASIESAIMNWSGHSHTPPLARIIAVYRFGGNYESWKHNEYNDKPETVVFK